MPDVNIQRPRLHVTEDADALQYRAVSVTALAALAVGVASLASLFSVVAWAVPVVGIVLGVAALRRIDAEAPALLGRKAALVGLTLSVIMCAAAPVEFFRYRNMIDREARRFGTLFFSYLRENAPHRAHQLTFAAHQRRPSNESLRESYPEGSEARQRLLEFASQPGIRAVLALGKGAEVRYFDTESQSSRDGNDAVDMVFAVTYRPEGEPTSFFITMRLMRMPSTDDERSYWVVNRTVGGGKPGALGGTAR